MSRTLIYLGGNGHCAARLAPAREALQRLSGAGRIAPFDLFDVPYPGFEGRPRAADLASFLNHVSASIDQAAGEGSTSLVYGTGIGGLLALCLRARGEALHLPLLMQAPVLWGLEHRLMPRLMRLPAVRRLLGWLFARPAFQRHFIRKQFEHRPTVQMQEDFFAGYARCTALPDFFAWLTPALLRRLEQDLAARPESLRNIRVWWGQRDRVVSLLELAWTEEALSVKWPLRLFPGWGHYPMIDEPDAWISSLAEALAETGSPGS